ncbi:hypothetical protein CHUAL_002836 [Chamberlinius hualienensis]
MAFALDKEDRHLNLTEDVAVDSENEMKIEQIRKWLLADAPFHARTDTGFIKKFLVGSKYDVKKTKQRIARYYENRRNYPDILTNRDICHSKSLELFNRGILVVDYDENDRSRTPRLFADFSRLKDGDNPYDVLKLGILMVESFLLLDNIVTEGSEWVVNSKDIPMSVLLQLTPKLIYKLVSCVLLGLPIRLKGIYFINIHPATMVAVNCLKTLLTPKLRGRLHLHKKSWSCLKKYFPSDHLPIEFEGSGGKLEDYLEKNREVLIKSRHYLLDDEQYGMKKEK